MTNRLSLKDRVRLPQGFRLIRPEDGTRRRAALTMTPSGACLLLRRSSCRSDLSRLRAQRLWIHKMSAIVGLCTHLCDVFLDVHVLPEVSLDLSGYIGTAIQSGPSQRRVELWSHRNCRLYHTPAIPGYSINLSTFGIRRLGAEVNSRVQVVPPERAGCV
jgi:hypothetical protein